MEVCSVYAHTHPFFTVPAGHPQLGHIENDSFKVLFNSPLGLNLFSALHPCLPHFLSDCGQASLSKQPPWDGPFLTSGAPFFGRLASSPPAPTCLWLCSLRITWEPCATPLAKLIWMAPTPSPHSSVKCRGRMAGSQSAHGLCLQPVHFIAPHL